MVTRELLIRLAGAVWLTVGSALVALASWWFHHATGQVYPWVAAGLLGGVLVHRLQLRHLVIANVRRIEALNPGQSHVRVWKFQAPRSYLLIALMIAVGYTLRHFALPKVYLAPVYLAMGWGLVLAGIGYFRSA